MPNHRASARLKHTRGTLRLDRLPPEDPAARLKRAPVPPETLSEAGKAEWRRLAPVAVRLGTLTSADLRSFELLAATLATAADAEAIIAREGVTVQAASGNPKSHPACQVLATARGQAEKLLGAFGLHPRGRTGVPIAPPSTDEEENFFRRNGVR
jgi:P27 family predicted phage terminase small subunit